MVADIADMSSSTMNRIPPLVLSSGECDIYDAKGWWHLQECQTIVPRDLQTRYNTTKYTGQKI